MRPPPTTNTLLRVSAPALAEYGDGEDGEAVEADEEDARLRAAARPRMVDGVVVAVGRRPQPQPIESMARGSSGSSMTTGRFVGSVNNC